MKGRKLFIKIVAIILAILMLGSVVVVAIEAFAVSPAQATQILTSSEVNKNGAVSIQEKLFYQNG